MAVTNFDEYRDVFVVADTIDDVVHPVTYELIGQARRIAKELGQLVQVILDRLFLLLQDPARLSTPSIDEETKRLHSNNRLYDNKVQTGLL